MRLYSSSPASISLQEALAESEHRVTCLHITLQVRKFVIRREVQPKKEGAKPYTKAPKIQRLVTPQRLQHKRHRIALKRRRAEASKDAAVSLPIDESTLHDSNHVTERVRPDYAQACRRAKGQAGRDQEEACIIYAQVNLVFEVSCQDFAARVFESTRHSQRLKGWRSSARRA